MKSGKLGTIFLTLSNMENRFVGRGFYNCAQRSGAMWRSNSSVEARRRREGFDWHITLVRLSFVRDMEWLNGVGSRPLGLHVGFWEFNFFNDMEIKGNKSILDHTELRALASVGAMALGNKRLAELLLKNQFELKKLNGEIRESDHRERT